MARSNLIRGVKLLRLAVYSSSDKIAHIPYSYSFFNKTLKLKLVIKFAKDLNKYIAKQEAKSKDDLEEV